MTKEMQDIENHLKEMKLPQQIRLSVCEVVTNPAVFFEAHLAYQKGSMPENMKEKYASRIRIAYGAVMQYNDNL